MSNPDETSRRGAFYAAQHEDRAHPVRCAPDAGTVRDLCTRDVVTADAGMMVAEAARRMRDQQVGALVVVEDASPTRHLVRGVVTDRDIALGIVAADRDPHACTLRDIMSTSLVTARAGDGVLDVLAQMKARQVRRVPVTGPAGELVGIVTLDDLGAALASQVQAIAGAVWSSRRRVV